MDKLTKYQNVANKKGGELLSTNISRNKLKWRCKEGHVFWLTIYKVHRKGQWCKQCGNSNGERIIRDILNEFNVYFKQQYRIDKLPNRKYDFYFEYNKKKYLIEYDGEQHFQFVRKYHKHRSEFIEKQLIDRIKTYIAWTSGYSIIRIDYTQLTNIKYHILNAINNDSLVYLSEYNLYKYITDIHLTQEQINKFVNIIIK